MPANTSRASYEDCFDLFDRALAAPSGIRNECPTRGAANHLRTRLNYARVLHRDESREVNEPDSPDYGISPYDVLIVRVVEADGQWWVYIEPRRVSGRVEELAAE